MRFLGFFPLHLFRLSKTDLLHLGLHLRQNVRHKKAGPRQLLTINPLSALTFYHETNNHVSFGVSKNHVLPRVFGVLRQNGLVQHADDDEMSVCPMHTQSVRCPELDELSGIEWSRCSPLLSALCKNCDISADRTFEGLSPGLAVQTFKKP